MAEFGIMTRKDQETMRAALNHVCGRGFPGQEVLTVCEIGVCNGDTARGLKEHLETLQVTIDYWGVDNGRDRSIDPPFDGAHLIVGPSEEVHMELPGCLEFLFIDGCHCANHIMLDFLNYSPKVRRGGLVAFHDVNPKAQDKGDYQGHGPHHVDFGTAARKALMKLGLYPSDDEGQLQIPGWKKRFEAWDDADWGGMAVFEKTFGR